MTTGILTDEQILLAAVLSFPADDTPRMQYADWWEENDQPERAEFVRVGCELARRIDERDRCRECVQPGEQHHNGPCRSPLKPLRRRERELLGANAHIWLFQLPPNLRPLLPEAIHRTWQRGFVGSITLSWQDWLRYHRALYWHPEQRVECPRCDGTGMADAPNGDIARLWPCEDCNSPLLTEHNPGRICPPMPPTAQPIREVRLTTRLAGTWQVDGVTAGEYRFARDKCPACEAGSIASQDCPRCHGKPLNSWHCISWHCEAWPTITFRMPE